MVSEVRTGNGAIEQPRLAERVPFDAPWEWLGAGWRDLWRIPQVSLVYGAVFAVASVMVLLGLTWAGSQSLVLVLAGGFLLVGPMLAVGLYEASRRLEASEAVSLLDVAVVAVKSPGQLAFMGVALLLVYFVWVEFAILLFMLFFGSGDMPPAEAFVASLLFTGPGLGLLVVGTAIGMVLAATVFAITAVSIPLMMVREIDVVTAVSTSVRAVRTHPRPMILWAALIAGAMALGIATAFIGLIIAFPLVGHATWHAFKDVVVED